jgi:hypothetical protein
MIRRSAFALLVATALPAVAQETIVIEPLDPVGELLDEVAPLEERTEDQTSTLPRVPDVEAELAASAAGGVVRVLDKISGQVIDLELLAGDSGEVGPLAVTLLDCRYPVSNPAGDSFVLLSIRHRAADPVFEGWMIASSPAVSAMDHPRYDVWALRCLIP